MFFAFPTNCWIIEQLDRAGQPVFHLQFSTSHSFIQAPSCSASKKSLEEKELCKIAESWKFAHSKTFEVTSIAFDDHYKKFSKMFAMSWISWFRYTIFRNIVKYQFHTFLCSKFRIWFRTGVGLDFFGQIFIRNFVNNTSCKRSTRRTATIHIAFMS